MRAATLSLVVFVPAFVLGVVVSTAANHALACGPLDLRSLAALAAEEQSGDPSGAIAALREAGPAGLEALLDVHNEYTRRHPEATPEADATLARLHALLDAVGQQRDCASSRLYWYTDMETARAAAAASGKPILSLRLLGRLSDELSCANSRFFRTALYANAEVSGYLREHFILHWQSVRPAPVITIDFGDGRRIERTITGNSIHYVLTSAGDVVDAAPGLYGPQAFLRLVKEAGDAARRAALLDGDARATFLREYRRDRVRALEEAWRRDVETVAALAVVPAPGAGARGDVPGGPIEPPTAAAAAEVAVGKFDVESPMIAALAEPARADDATWKRIAALHAADARLDRGSVALMAAKQPAALSASRVSLAKHVAESPLLRLVRSFEASMAEDTVRNDYLRRPQILARLVEEVAAGPRALEELNERVYAELFLTPSSDPWLGLVSDGVYTALPRDGVHVAASASPDPAR